MDKSRLKHFYSLKKAKDYALFKTFMNRTRREEYVVVPSYKDQYTVILKADALEKGFEYEEVSNLDLSELTIQEMEEILLDDTAIEPFLTLRHTLISLSPHTWSFLIQKKLPLEQFIIVYLINAGIDSKGNDAEYDQAKSDWIKSIE